MLNQFETQSYTLQLAEVQALTGVAQETNLISILETYFASAEDQYPDADQREAAKVAIMDYANAKFPPPEGFDILTEDGGEVTRDEIT